MPHPHLRLVRNGHPQDAEASQLLGESEGGFLLAMVQQSPDCIKLIDADGSLSFMNYNGQCAMQIDDFAALRGAEWASLWPEEARPMIRDAVRRGLEGESSRFEAACPTARGEARWWDVAVSPVRGADGRVQRLASISRDITRQVLHERKIAEHEAQLASLNELQAHEIAEKSASLEATDVIMREVDHRVKNSLNLVSSMLKMQARTIKGEAREKLRDAADRVAMIARVHEQIYSSASMTEVAMDEFLEGLSKRLLEANGAASVQIETEFCERTLTGAEAVSLGLILAELIGNALRHGLGKRGNGAIRIGCEEIAGGRTRLSVGDSGMGFADGFDLRLAEGLGSKVVQAYAAKLGGEVKTGRSALGGAEVAVVF